tara:strand:- start:919 stop:1086 length:168 start_codon:yes stop_codon:yes gene_type:complete
MKMREVVKETRIWKEEYLNLDVIVAKQRSEYCKIQNMSGRKDHYKIYEEARRLFK